MKRLLALYAVVICLFLFVSVADARRPNRGVTVAVVDSGSDAVQGGAALTGIAALGPISWFRGGVDLFQDTGGSTAVSADAQPIQRWNDQGSLSTNMVEATNNPSSLSLNSVFVVNSGSTNVLTGGTNMDFDRFDALSIIAVVNATGYTSFHTITSRWQSANPGWFFGVYNTDRVWFQMSKPGGEGMAATGTTVLSAGTTYTLAITKDTSGSNAGYTFYVDGVGDGLTSLDNDLVSSIAGSRSVHIGADASGVGQFNGRIAEVIYFDKELSAAEVLSSHTELATKYGH